MNLWRFVYICGSFLCHFIVKILSLFVEIWCVFVEVLCEFMKFCGVFECIYGYFVWHCEDF